MEALFSDYEEARKSGLFDAEHYLATYPDVAERNIDPLVHYLEEGAREGRNPRADFDSAFYLEQCTLRGEPPGNPLLHYIRIGAARGFKTRRDAFGVAGADRERPAGKGARAADLPGNPAGKQPILVAIESLGVVGAPDGASRLSLSGWALAAGRIAEITASIDGAVVGTATYGVARPDIAKLYPDRDGAGHCGFILAFDLPSLKSGAIDPVLTVRTADGEIGHRPLRVEIPPQEVDVGIADPLDPAGSLPEKPGPLPMQLYIDDVTVDPTGILRLQGWVVCLVQIESVDALIDGAVIGKTEFGRVRPDVEKALPDYPNARFSGFRLVVDASFYGAGWKTITVRAVARTGISGEATAPVRIPELAIASTTHPETGLSHHCDEIALTTAGRIALKGWAVSASPVAAILVLLDGEQIGEAELGLERPDIGNLYPAFAHARRPGFAFETQSGKVIAGEHEITLRICLADGQTHDERIPLVASETRHARGTEMAGDADRKLHLDSPRLIAGSVETPVRGNLEISGWALARAGVAAIEIAIDGTQFALADYGLRRLDLRAAFPDWDDALCSGYSASLPHRVLPKGSHAVSVALRDKTGRTASIEFRMEVEDLSDAQGPWSLRRKMAQAEIDLVTHILEQCRRQPLFVVVLPVAEDDASLRRARATLASLYRQAYPNWRLAIAPQAAGARPRLVRDRLLARLGATADRADVLDELSPDIVARMASEASLAPGEVFLTVLSPGDVLGVDAFLEMALATAMHAGADFFYSDERRRNPASGAVEAFFKPQWSPDLLASTNYVGRLWCARADLIQAVAPPAETLLGHGEYDLILRCTEAATAIRHIPAVLCERAEEGIDDPEQSPAQSPAQSPDQSEAALARMLARANIAGDIRPGAVPGTYRVKRALATRGLVSIIIPTCAAQGLIETCIETLRRLTAYRNYEIICVENIASKDRKWRGWLRRNADRVISAKIAYNWSRFNHLATPHAKGEYLLFLNDDIEVIDPDWLDALIEQAQRPEIGVVGPRLLYPDRRVQHAGMFLAAIGQARHAFRYAAEDDPGYFGLALTQRNVIAVTGACLLTRRDTFDALGGFDETQSIVNNDLDYCLRSRQKGWLTVYTPHATLVHHEAVSRIALDDEYDVAAFDSKWRDLFLAGDPYFNPHLSKNQDDFAIDHEPTQLLVTGRPTMRRTEVGKILVVKLDHIGDCIISFPAVRRLKQHFPDARITVLTSHASRPVWSLEASVDETIEFDFFHARSGLGELERSDEDWDELRQRLSGGQFDLAVDLRKHTETRPVLQHTGARCLAGFDFRNQFPWLDIALEWTGDQIYARKHQHNGDDLVNLVDAISASCESDRTVIVARPAATPTLAALTHGKSSGPLICVHPTVGNDARQWPIEYFAAVIDRLVEADGARIVLIGAPGDEEAAAAILDRVRQPKAVTSLVGKLPLAELPALLVGVSLFLGNNSGPKHIAAGLGVPTVGIHSGTEDVREWGPVGPSAIAVAREVVCAPCYLAHAADCRRGLACLRELEPARVYDACKRLLLAAPEQPALRPGSGDAPAAARPARPGLRRSGRPNGAAIKPPFAKASL
jgi:ADP-heptose:LPS heptosyltransferase/GT2 family glycosyltransferase